MMNHNRLVGFGLVSVLAIAALPESLRAQQMPTVSAAEQNLTKIEEEYKQKLLDAKVALKAARIAQAKEDIKAAEVADAKADAAKKVLAAENGSDTKATTTDKPDTSAENADSDANSFAGLKFGVGLSLTVDIGSSDRIVKASYVNGIVRADQTDNAKPRIMLESHYFFPSSGTFLGLDAERWGLGPFVAIRPGSDDIIDAIAFGGMIGFRRSTEGSDSFNIGIGLVIDPNVQILGEGIKLNQPLPAGETDIRFRQTSQKGLIGMVSFSF